VEATLGLGLLRLIILAVLVQILYLALLHQMVAEVAGHTIQQEKTVDQEVVVAVMFQLRESADQEIRLLQPHRRVTTAEMEQRLEAQTIGQAAVVAAHP
jgi:hypothetical protein